MATLQQDITRLQKVAPPTPNTAHSLPPSFLSHTPTNSAASFIALDKVDTSTGQKPTQLRLPDGTVIKIGKWKDILRECCKFALTHNLSIPIPFPDKAGRKVALFNTVKPATGISYVSEQYNGQQIYIYVNYDANNCIANAMHVLKQVPASQHKVEPAVTFD